MTDQRIKVQVSFNKNFCSILEYFLSAAFTTSTNTILKYWGCDGIYEPVINEQFTNRNITTIKQVTTKTWIGVDGNSQYDMIIKLGRRSRRKALKGLDLVDCLPNVEFADWVNVDMERAIIAVQLI